jgi:RNA polymerase sigma-70 factor (ECF subfamily)
MNTKSIKIDDKFIISYKDHVQDLLYLKDNSLQEQDLEELNQEVFYKALLYQDYYEEGKGSVSTWLGMLVTHVYDRYLRERDQLDTKSINDDSSEAYMVTEDDLLHETNNHYYYTNRDEIDSYISLLPKKQRKVVYLKLIQGFTYAEISSEVGSTESTNRSNFEAGIKNLRRLLQSDNPEEELLQEITVLKPYGDKSYSGDWAWRPNESPDRSAGEVKRYTPAEVKEYCKENNLMYAGE